MTITLVENEIRRFLSSKRPEVICISGHWGVGKTFAWNKYLSDARAKNEISLKRYSYVSLFGINSLDALKYSVFENSIDAPDATRGPTLESLQSNFIFAARAWTRKLAVLAKQTPFLNNYVGGVMPAWFAAVRETVICIDDFERRGDDLSVKDVLGLVNNLKELRKCKVCLILNDEALENDQQDFQKYLEKVVDKKLKFTPSARECTQIALNESDETSALLAEFCIKLGISNIRVIKKIEQLIDQAKPLIAKLHKQLLRQTVHSLTLLGWSTYEPAKAPSIDYLKKKDTTDFLRLRADEKEPKPEKEVAWDGLLSNYQFTSMDEFDLALLDGTESGFFDPDRVGKAASELNRKIEAGDLDAAFNAAWDMLHNSFDDNQEEVLDKMYVSFFKGAQYITPMNMNSTVVLFKELGREKQALRMLRHYIDVRSERPEALDLRHDPFSDRVSDPDVIKAFRAKYDAIKATPEPREILLRIASTNGWSPEDIAALAETPTEGYYDLLRNTKGNDLRKIIRASLLFDTISNADAPYKEISRRAKEALRKIGAESRINAWRIRWHGVRLDPPRSPGDNDVQD